jgi:hypothetical protein
MSKRRNDNDTSKDNIQATGKRARNHTAGLRVARPPAAQSRSRSTAISSSTSTCSRITTLALGPKGRRVGKRKDKSHTATQSTPSAIPSTADLAPVDTQLEVGPKPKRKRNNKTKVCDSVAAMTSLTESNPLRSQNSSSGSRFEMPPLTRSYAMTDWETMEDNTAVTCAILSLAFSNVKIAWAEVGFAVRPVLLRRTRILRCTV